MYPYGGFWLYNLLHQNIAPTSNRLKLISAILLKNEGQGLSLFNGVGSS
jgi:hypothetical protein